MAYEQNQPFRFMSFKNFVPDGMEGSLVLTPKNIFFVVGISKKLVSLQRYFCPKYLINVGHNLMKN